MSKNIWVGVFIIALALGGCEAPQERWTVVVNERWAEDLPTLGCQYVQVRSESGQVVNMFMTDSTAQELYPLNHSWLERKPQGE